MVVYLMVKGKEINFSIPMRRSWIPVHDGFFEGPSWLDDPKKESWKTTDRRYQYLNGVWITKEQSAPVMTNFFDTPLNEKDYSARLGSPAPRSVSP